MILRRDSILPIIRYLLKYLSMQLVGTYLPRLGRYGYQARFQGRLARSQIGPQDPCLLSAA